MSEIDEQEMADLFNLARWRLARLGIRPNHPWYDEAMSELLLSIAKARRRWRPGGPASFKTYATQAMLFAALNFVKRLERMDQHERYVGDWPVNLHPVREQGVREQADLAEAVRNAVATLPAREAVIISLRMNGSLLREVGALLGVGLERARQLEAQAHERLRYRLRKIGWEQFGVETR